MFFMIEVRLRPLIGGIASLIPGAFSLWDHLRPMGDPRPPEFGRNIWRERLEDVRKAGLTISPQTVLELGPGRSLSALISALLDGATRAIGVDAVPYATQAENLRVLDTLATEADIDEARRAELRQNVAAAGIADQEDQLLYRAPWSDPAVIPAASVDYIFSISVLEHVTAPDVVYRACYTWLRPGGVMAHKIDFSSHGITRHWNGHYWTPDWLWMVIVGRRTYSINRWLPDDHVQAAKKAGFEVVSVQSVKDEDNALLAERDKPARRFRAHPPDALGVRTCTLVLKKPQSGAHSRNAATPSFS